MRIQELLGMPLVAVDRGIRLGSIQGVELDPNLGRLRYVRVKAEDHRPDAVVPWEALRSIGRDAVTVDSPLALQETIPGADCDRMIAHFGDRPVVTESGTRIGHVTSYEFDPVTGAITTYHVSPGGLVNRLIGRDVEFTQDLVRSVGVDAVIVSDAVLPAKAA